MFPLVNKRSLERAKALVCHEAWGSRGNDNYITFTRRNRAAQQSGRFTMATSTTAPRSPSTFLSPGQKFLADDLVSSGGSRTITVARLSRDDSGLMHVVLRNDDGREISAFVEQVELAIKLGNLRPAEETIEGITC